MSDPDVTKAQEALSLRLAIAGWPSAAVARGVAAIEALARAVARAEVLAHLDAREARGADAERWERDDLATADPSPPAGKEGEPISPSDPDIIIAGIRQFGLAPDGSDLRDLQAALSRVTRERDEAIFQRDKWFKTHDSHRQANEALGKANGELFKRAYEAEAARERAERERDEQGRLKAGLSARLDKLEPALLQAETELAALRTEHDELKAKWAEPATPPASPDVVKALTEALEKLRDWPNPYSRVSDYMVRDLIVEALALAKGGEDESR